MKLLIRQCAEIPAFDRLPAKIVRRFKPALASNKAIPIVDNNRMNQAVLFKAFTESLDIAEGEGLLEQLICDEADAARLVSFYGRFKILKFVFLRYKVEVPMPMDSAICSIVSP